MSRRCSLLLLLVALLCTGVAQAEPDPVAARERFALAAAAYEAGEYASALAGWQALVDEGWSGLELHYNLGNACWRAGQVGPAILAWERAARLAPLDRDVQKNLEIARALLPDRFEPDLRLPLWDAVDRGLQSLPRAGLAWAALLFAAATAAWISLRALVPAPGSAALARRRTVLHFLLAPTLLLLLLLPLQDRVLDGRARGVLLADRVEVRSAPSDGSTALFDLHEGATVVLGRRAVDGSGHAWRRLELPDGRAGWVPARTLEAIVSQGEEEQ
jgi:tetratricopeptide (TPR) repeat protein